jgi:hypothetical protein
MLGCVACNVGHFLPEMFDILILHWREEHKKQEPGIKMVLIKILTQGYSIIFVLIYSYFPNISKVEFMKYLLVLSILHFANSCPCCLPSHHSLQLQEVHFTLDSKPWSAHSAWNDRWLILLDNWFCSKYHAIVVLTAPYVLISQNPQQSTMQMH